MRFKVKAVRSLAAAKLHEYLAILHSFCKPEMMCSAGWVPALSFDVILRDFFRVFPEELAEEGERRLDSEQNFLTGMAGREKTLQK